MWLIKTEHGYMLEDKEGNLVKFFDMAANCKAYCREQEIVPLYLTKRTPNVYCEIYENDTGKTLWWNRD